MVVSQVSSVCVHTRARAHTHTHTHAEMLPCIFMRVGEMRAPEIFGSQ